MVAAKSTCGIDVTIAGPRCAFPPEDEALLIAADRAGATHDEKTVLIKQLLEKNGLPWLEDEPPNWSE